MAAKVARNWLTQVGAKALFIEPGSRSGRTATLPRPRLESFDIVLPLSVRTYVRMRVAYERYVYLRRRYVSLTNQRYNVLRAKPLFRDGPWSFRTPFSHNAWRRVWVPLADPVGSIRVPVAPN
jgi:hypothetical protein